MARQNWVVTGAAGFLGSHVIEKLLNDGQDVTAIDDLSWGKEEYLSGFEDNPNFHFYKADVREVRGLRSIFQKSNPEHIIHLAALHFIPLAMKQPTLTASINLVGTQAILEAMRDTQAKSFFFASAGNVYKNMDTPLDEENTPLEPMDIYGLSKVMGEQLVKMESHKQPDKRLIRARIFNLIGPRETNHHIIPTIMDQLKANKSKIKLGNLWPIRDYVPVDQAAQATIDLCLKSPQGVTTCNLATGVGLSVQDLIDHIQNIIGNNIEVSLDPESVRKVDRAKLVANVERLHSIIGWTPTHKVQEILSMLLQAESII